VSLYAGMKEKRADVVAEMKRLQAETEVITKIFEDEDISKSIQSTRSVCTFADIQYRTCLL